MKKSVAEIARKMDALNLWESLDGCNFAVCPRGTVFPYFCTAMRGELPQLKVRFIMLEGWQTFHDYLRARADANFGISTSPIELPHYDLLILENGDFKAFRYDAGYVPREMRPKDEPLLVKILWESYGIMMRLESDEKLPLRYADEQAIFSRVERPDGTWEDAPLAIVQPQPYSERVAFDKKLLKRAGDLPFAAEEAVTVHFGLILGITTAEPRPRCVYELSIVDFATKRDLFRERTSMLPGVGLKGMWETMPQQVLSDLVQMGRIPGKIRCTSPRVFRFLRPLCLELPIKLSLHDAAK